MSTSDRSLTFNCLHKRPSAKVRLFCFPWAGGGSTAYARWGEHTHPDIEVIGIRLPGRESRQEVPFATSYTPLCKDLADEIHNRYGDKPFAFFGHSMGISLAYETAREMVDKYTVEPVHMFLSGSFAPHSVVREKRMQVPQSEGLHIKSDDDLLAIVGKGGGTPSQVLNNTEYMREIFLPVFRADLKLAFHYYRPEAPKFPFKMDITFFDGDKDSDHILAEFPCLTTGAFKSHMMPGGHFYLQKEDNRTAILKTIAEALLGNVQ